MHTCYLGTFVQRTLNSGQSSATTSLTDSFKSLCEWEEEAGDGQRGPDAGAAGAAAADAASGAARAAGAAAGASETCLLPCHILCFCHYATRQAFEQCFGPHLLFHQQNVDLSLTIILLFTCFFLACHCHREFVHWGCAPFVHWEYAN